MIDSKRQEMIMMAMNEGKSESESLKDLTLSCPPTRPMGAIKDEAEELVACRWAKYKEDPVNPAEPFLAPPAMAVIWERIDTILNGERS